MKLKSLKENRYESRIIQNQRQRLCDGRDLH
jgi:hypothetical protein